MADAFENILGQPKVREFLRASVVSERVTQAYLFVGPAGSTKTQAAYALAQALMCPKGPRGPRGGSCGACDRCGRILRRKHPDVRYFAPAGANGYLVEQVREIVADTALSPIQADKKIYILDRVDQLGASAANAFLKTLEEPADDVVMILLGRTRESVLPTIVSRCQVVPFRHIPASEAAGIVAQNTGADPAQARQAIEACGGRPPPAAARFAHTIPPRPWRFCGRREASASPSGRGSSPIWPCFSAPTTGMWWRWPARSWRRRRRRSTRCAPPRRRSLPRTPTFSRNRPSAR